RGFIVVAFCSAILHHWMCKIPTEVATLTVRNYSLSAIINCKAAQSYNLKGWELLKKLSIA
ncbi:hypothetical protein, partial [Piscirickettsia salmonis]